MWKARATLSESPAYAERARSMVAERGDAYAMPGIDLTCAP
ncbi:hypothetical protein [Xanthomonas sp.]|nr:hypothetical protein [Xanthomonas sp.]